MVNSELSSLTLETSAQIVLTAVKLKKDERLSTERRKVDLNAVLYLVHYKY